MNLKKYKNLIGVVPMHIATVNEDNKPNLSVASNVIIIDEKTLIISICEMVNTQNNIKNNPNITLTAFDSNWIGVRIFGKAQCVEEGKYYDMCKEKFFPAGKKSKMGATKPKCVLIINVEKIEDFE